MLDRGSDGSSRGSSTGSSTDGAGISISPVPTPKDGSSVVRALAHKQHHGYLPTPTAAKAGQVQRHFSLRAAATETETQPSPAGRIIHVPDSLLQPSTVTAAAAPAAPTAAASAAASPPAALGLHQNGQCAGAAGTQAGEGDTADMPPLALGAVPTFGGCAAGVKHPGHTTSASSVQDTPSAAVQGVSTGTARSGVVSEPLQLGPSSLPGPLLLAVSPHLPPALQREHWCLVDFVVLKKLYDGYASVICKVRHVAASMGRLLIITHTTCLPRTFRT